MSINTNLKHRYLHDKQNKNDLSSYYADIEFYVGNFDS